LEAVVQDTIEACAFTELGQKASGLEPGDAWPLLTHTHLFIDWLRGAGKYATPRRQRAPVLEWQQEQRLDVAMRWEISSDLTEAKRRPRYAAWIGPHAAGRSRS
jgi:hypothetical protein